MIAVDILKAKLMRRVKLRFFSNHKYPLWRFLQTKAVLSTKDPSAYFKRSVQTLSRSIEPEQKMLIKGSESHQQGVFCASQWDH